MPVEGDHVVRAEEGAEAVGVDQDQEATSAGLQPREHAVEAPLPASKHDGNVRCRISLPRAASVLPALHLRVRADLHQHVPGHAQELDDSREAQTGDEARQLRQDGLQPEPLRSEGCDMGREVRHVDSVDNVSAATCEVAGGCRKRHGRQRQRCVLRRERRPRDDAGAERGGGDVACGAGADVVGPGIRYAEMWDAGTRKSKDCRQGGSGDHREVPRTIDACATPRRRKGPRAYSRCNRCLSA
mmetsp:Transcript_119840/g.339681  ORF Transcript_119840/g.339681 Transcript_119840/m.339681 type:complete len:243 (-) Transcript_119840:8-736(-)